MIRFLLLIYSVVVILGTTILVSYVLYLATNRDKPVTNEQTAISSSSSSSSQEKEQEETEDTKPLSFTEVPVSFTN